MELRYFTFDEFDSPDYPGSGYKYMDREFVACLDEARDIAGIQFEILSGYRTQKVNNELNGVTASSHIIANATTIKYSNNVKR